MAHTPDRRELLQAGVAAGTLAFLGRLPFVAAQEARLSPERMALTDDIAPLVRLIEDTPREKLLEEVAARIKRGTTFQQIVTAVMLAGVRSIQPRPVGFKFHAVLVVHSAYQASLNAPDRDRWLPLFWALDNFKASQARNAQEGNWKLGPIPSTKKPSSIEARQRFTAAMDAWDEAGADAAICAWSETASANELFEVLVKYAARDMRDIGHKIIYLANGWRTLEAIGWRHSLPILRSLVYAVLDRGRDPNPSQNDLPVDRPWKEHARRVTRFPHEWVQGKNGGEKSIASLLQVLRKTDQQAACDALAQEVEHGIGGETVWQAVLIRAAELTVQQPGIIGLHSVTSTNAMHYAFKKTADDQTRRMLLLQAVAFVAMFRERMGGNKLNDGVTVANLEPVTPGNAGPAALDDIFADVRAKRLDAIRKTVSLLQANKLDPNDFLRRGRQMIYLKGNDSHDYKLSEAVWEDCHHVIPAFRPYYLAASLSNLHGSTDPDNSLVQRTRALAG